MSIIYMSIVLGSGQKKNQYISIEKNEYKSLVKNILDNRKGEKGMLR